MLEREGALLPTERRPVSRMTTQDFQVLPGELAALSILLATWFPKAPGGHRDILRKPFFAGIAVFIPGILSLDETWWEIRQTDDCDQPLHGAPAEFAQGGKSDAFGRLMKTAGQEPPRSRG